MATIMVTNMPFWAEKVGAPRTMAVEFPFGHILGPPGDRELQMRVIQQALAVLENAAEPGTTVHSNEVWPGSLEEARQICHPPEPPPIMDEMSRHIISFMRGIRRKDR
jgi:D-proline reductase (dithiol) PrdB